MTSPILFYSDLCPDTAPFVEELEKLDISYEVLNIFESMSNFKRFLQIRDTNAYFDETKKNGYAGIPALVINERVILSINEL
nr:hypothetical protein [Gammaproteobacteria bacterium]